jgi:hypothetical protein
MNGPNVALPQESAQSAVAAYLDRLLASWQDPKVLTPARLVFVFFFGLVLICGVAALTGAVPTRIYGHDVFVPVDAGWRIINGQRPHLDFTSGWGPVWFLAEGLGLTLSRHSVDGVGYANAIVALLVGTWSFFLGDRRLASLPRILLGWFLAALVAAPYPLGVSPFLSSHAMTYNRYGYALLGLILLECLPATGDSDESHEEGWTGGFSTGAALSLTLFLKASYFFIAVVLIAGFALLLRRLARRRILGIALGFASVSICLLAYLRFDIAAVLGDLHMAGAARAAAVDNRLVISNALHLSILLRMAFFVVVTALLFSNRNPRWRRLRLPAIGALLFLADVGLMSTNAQGYSFPLCAIFAILMVNEIAKYQPPPLVARRFFYRPLYLGALLLAALLVVPQFARDVVGLGYGLWSKHKVSGDTMVPRFTPPNLQPLVLYNFWAAPQSNGVTFINYVNDGVALLERNSRPDETIITMDMTNPFSFALGRLPAQAGIESPTYNYNIDDTHRPSDDRFFGNADIVMVPKRPAIDAVFFVGFYQAYKPGLQRRFYLAAESPLWWMYRRK